MIEFHQVIDKHGFDKHGFDKHGFDIDQLVLTTMVLTWSYHILKLPTQGLI